VSKTGQKMQNVKYKSTSRNSVYLQQTLQSVQNNINSQKTMYQLCTRHCTMTSTVSASRNADCEICTTDQCPLSYQCHEIHYTRPTQHTARGPHAVHWGSLCGLWQLSEIVYVFFNAIVWKKYSSLRHIWETFWKNPLYIWPPNTTSLLPKET
jgi:hypothetical protein